MDDNYENASGCAKLIVTIETSSKVNKMGDDFSVKDVGIAYLRYDSN